MLKRAVKVILIIFGSPFILYFLGIYTNQYILTRVNDGHYTTIDSFGDYMAIIFGHGLLGACILICFGLVLFLIGMGLRELWRWIFRYIKTGRL